MRPDEVIAEAVAATGLDDFGGDGFREGLEVYCDAVAGADPVEVGPAVTVWTTVVVGFALPPVLHAASMPAASATTVTTKPARRAALGADEAVFTGTTVFDALSGPVSG